MLIQRQLVMSMASGMVALAGSQGRDLKKGGDILIAGSSPRALSTGFQITLV